jgi:hypothetical protein
MIAIVVAIALVTTHAEAQTAINLIALQGLAPVSALDDTSAGRAALAANLTITDQRPTPKVN